MTIEELAEQNAKIMNKLDLIFEALQLIKASVDVSMKMQELSPQEFHDLVGNLLTGRAV
jgi:hypothetical protein